MSSESCLCAFHAIILSQVEIHSTQIKLVIVAHREHKIIVISSAAIFCKFLCHLLRHLQHLPPLSMRRSTRTWCEHL